MTATNLPARILPAGDRAGRLAEAFTASSDARHTRYARRRDLLGPATTAHSPAWLPWCAGRGIDPLGQVRPAYLLAWLADLAATGDAESTRNRRLSTVSAWHEWLVREEVVAANPVRLLKPAERPRPAKRVHPVSPTAVPSREQLVALQAAADELGPVASVLVALMSTTGARVSELAAVDVGDFRHDRGHTMLDLAGKGGGHRIVPVAPMAWRRVQDLLEHRTEPGDRLPAVEAGTRRRRALLAWSTGRSMRRQDLARLLDRALRRADLGHLRLTPHSLRGAYATLLLADGVPIYDVQQSMGHVSPETTIRYDRGHLDPDRHPAYRMAALLAGAYRPA